MDESTPTKADGTPRILFVGDSEERARSMRTAELIICGVEELVAPEEFIEPAVVVEELKRRREASRADLETLARGIIKGHGDFKNFAEPQSLKTYAQLMQSVAIRFPAEGLRWMKKDIKEGRPDYTRDQVKERIELVEAAYALLKQFARPGNASTEVQRLFRWADATAIDLDVYFLRNPNKHGRPQIMITKEKTLRSSIEKVARRAVTQLGGSDVSTKPKRIAPEVRGLVRMNDPRGRKSVYVTRAEVQAVVGRMHQYHQNGIITIAYDQLGDNKEHGAVRDYITVNRLKGRPYEAVHINIIPPSGGPDLIELGMETLDALLLEIFDPRAGHLAYNHRRLRIEKQKGEKLNADNSVTPIPWSRSQERLNANLYELLIATYSPYAKLR